jgi:hypothetical protein
MFFADPVAAFAHLRTIAAPGARMVFSCFRAPRDNPWMPDMRMLFPDEPPPAPSPPGAPGPFAFADPDRVAAILQQAGWHDLGFEAVDFAYVAGAGADPVADAQAFFSRIGPAAAAIRLRPEEEQARAKTRLCAWIEENRRDSLVVFPGAAWIVSAQT